MGTRWITIAVSFLVAALVGWLLVRGCAGQPTDHGDQTRPATGPAALDATTVERRISRLQELQDGGHDAAVLRDSELLLQALPDSAQPFAWEIPFNRRLIAHARLGKRYGYYFRSHFGVVGEDLPELPVPEKWQSDQDAEAQVELATVTCVDLRDGKRLWTRPVSHSGVAIDPRDDALWFWPIVPQSSAKPTAIRLDSLTGEITRQATLPPLRFEPGDSEHRLEGLREAGISFWRRWESHEPWRDIGFEFDLDTQTIVGHARPPQILSWNRLSYLSRGASRGQLTSVLLRPNAPGAEAEWTFAAGGHVVGSPIWMGGEQVADRGGPTDVLAAVQPPAVPGVVVRLDGVTGQPVWRSDLTEAIASEVPEATFHHGWPLVGESGGYVTAVGSRHTVFLLDPETGAIHRTFAAPAALLDQPRIVDGALILATRDSLLAVPLDGGDSQEAPAWQRIGHLRVRSLLGLQKPEQAFEEARALTQRAPTAPLAWQALAEAAELHGEADVRAEAPSIWARYMSEAGLESLKTLEEQVGLLRRLPTGQVVGWLIPTEDELLLAQTAGGELLTIDPQAIRIVARDLTQPAWGMSFERDTLYGRGAEGLFTIRKFLTPPPLPEDHPLMLSDEERVIRSTGKHQEGGLMVEPVDGGGTVLTLDGEITRHPPVLEGVGAWKIVRIGGRLLGYGQGGVFTLDEQYRPVSRLVTIDPPADVDQFDDDPQTVHAITSNDATMALLAGPEQRVTLQLRSAEGELLREYRVTPPGRSIGGVMPLADGYLYYGRELVWMPADPQGMIWSFRRNLSRQVLQRERRAGEDIFFAKPMVIGDKLFVAADGALYVFSVDHITRRRGGVKEAP